MAMIEFRLPKKSKQNQQIGGVQFVDGVCTLRPQDAAKVERILVRFNGCERKEIVNVEQKPDSTGEEGKPSLAIDSTKAQPEKVSK